MSLDRNKSFHGNWGKDYSCYPWQNLYAFDPCPEMSLEAEGKGSALAYWT